MATGLGQGGNDDSGDNGGLPATAGLDPLQPSLERLDPSPATAGTTAASLGQDAARSAAWPKRCQCWAVPLLLLRQARDGVVGAQRHANEGRRGGSGGVNSSTSSTAVVGVNLKLPSKSLASNFGSGDVEGRTLSGNSWATSPSMTGRTQCASMGRIVWAEAGNKAGQPAS
uniref:Uncharacterized protein n=1 Tax=Oryza punctata TaxID=4537 RepID=A0A0E0MPC0_ORYPU